MTNDEQTMEKKCQEPRKARRKTEYFLIEGASRFPSKAEAEKYVNNAGLTEGTLIVKGTAVETRTVETVKLG